MLPNAMAHKGLGPSIGHRLAHPGVHRSQGEDGHSDGEARKHSSSLGIDGLPLAQTGAYLMPSAEATSDIKP